MPVRAGWRRRLPCLQQELALYASHTWPESVGKTLSKDGAYDIGGENESPEVLKKLGAGTLSRRYIRRDIEDKLRPWLMSASETSSVSGVSK